MSNRSQRERLAAPTFPTSMSLGAIVLAGVLSVITSRVVNAEPQWPAWVPAMRQVAATGSGEAGVLLNVGDSISYSMAYFAPLQWIDRETAPCEVFAAETTLNAFINPACYRWKGPEHGNASGKTAAWGLQHLDHWIETHRPQLAVVMFGTNDIRRDTLERHTRHLRQLIERCLEQGVVVILTTIPPMDGHDDQVAEAVAAQRRLAAELNVPLIDFYAHVMNRRGEDWNGKLPQFDGFETWQAPTLIAQDGVHLSNPDRWRGDFSEAGLCRNGNTLRNYLTLLAVAEVIEVVFERQSPSVTTGQILGANPPPPENLPAVATPDGAASTSVEPPIPGRRCSACGPLPGRL